VAVGDGARVGAVGVGVVLDVAVADGLGGALDGDSDGVGLALGDEVALAVGGAADAVDVVADGCRDGDDSGTLARTSSGRASSRCGVSYENSPPAKAAAAAIATAAPPEASSTVRRCRCRGLR